MVAAPELDRIGLANADEDVADAEAPRLRNRHERISSEFVGGDGVAIQLGPSWSHDRMRRQPAERNRNSLSRPCHLMVVATEDSCWGVRASGAHLCESFPVGTFTLARQARHKCDPAEIIAGRLRASARPGRGEALCAFLG
jgi:hypothetical protein